MTRKPAVAGHFYPAAKEMLKKTVAEYLVSDRQPQKVFGLAAPHAGYIYSGRTAGHTYAAAIIPERVIILSPNHTGMGASAAIMTQGEWLTPLGAVPVNTEIAEKLLAAIPLLKEDSTAHVAEHSLEVQLPFLQMKQKNLSIVPICLKHMYYENCRLLGSVIAKVITESGGDILIVASTDMNHYESQTTTIEKDNLAIEKVIALDPEGLLNVCADNGITMCGAVPTAIMLSACLELGATKAELVEHTTSGDVSGDYDAVVGYAGFVVF